MDRDSSSVSQRGSFHYVDFRRNAVRGPDSVRESVKEAHKDFERASWTRSPTRASRDGGQRPRNDKWNRNEADVFQDLLPMELKRRSSQGQPQRNLNNALTLLRKSTGRVSEIPGTTWQQPSPTVKIPIAPVSSFMDSDVSSVGQEETWKKQVEHWFQEADTKGNGRIEGDEAVAFFSRTGLPDEDLSKMWRYAVPSGEHCMSKMHFINALKLVAVLQNDGRLTQDTVVRAVSERFPCPGPKIIPLNNNHEDNNVKAIMNEDEQYPLHDNNNEDSSSSEEDSPQKSRAFSMPVVSGLIDWSDKPLKSGPTTQEISLDVEYSAEIGESGWEDVSGPSKACLVSIPLRLAPLKYKESANLRNIIGFNTSLIAAPALNGGVLQYYKIQEHPQGINDGHFKKLDTEDADSAFCSEILPSHQRSSAKVTCMLADEASGYLFLGYDDSFVEMHHVGKEPIMLTKRVNFWKAHKNGSIDAMAMTLWGDLWTGSSKGSIRVWSDLTPGRDPASRVLRRIGGEKPHGGVTSIVVSSCGYVVWTAGQNNIALWQAYNGEYLGRIETDKLFEHNTASNSLEKSLRINTNHGLDLDFQGRIVHATSFGHRTPNIADDGEGDVSGTGLKVAVGKVAKIIGKGTKRIQKRNNKGPMIVPCNEDEPSPSFSPIQGVAAMLDRCMWVSYKNGLLERFTWNGRFKEKRFFTCGISCLCTVGDRLWIGLIDGTLSVSDLDFKELKQWSAHEATIIHLAVLGPLVYSLAADGSIKSWSHRIPHQMLDSMAWQKFMSCLKDLTEPHSFKVLCGTWNVNQARPPLSSLKSWLCDCELKAKADFIVLGLQEVEGAGSVAKTMTYGKYAKSNSDKGNATANWWAEQFQVTLDCYNSDNGIERQWKRLALRQMSGIIIYVFSRNKWMSSIGNIRTDHVGTGVMGVGSNKGGVAITFNLFRRRVTFVASHFAAHKQNVEKRNAEYQIQNRLLTFTKEKESVGVPVLSPQASRSSATSSTMHHPQPIQQPQQIHHHHHQQQQQQQQLRNQYGEVNRMDSCRSMELETGVGVGGMSGNGNLGSGTGNGGEQETQLSKGLQKAEFLVWLGDFNYRVDRSYSEAMHLIRNKKALEMLEHDQCRNQMKLNKLFVGLREGTIRFNPTYKFAKNITDINGYDSEKERVPSWTDRIFFRGSKSFVGIDDDDEDDQNGNRLSSIENLSKSEAEPLISFESASMSFLDVDSSEVTSNHDVGDIVVHCERYDTCMDVIDSDHKPVWCLLDVHFPAFTQGKMRKTSFDILREEMSRMNCNVALHISTKFIDFIGDGYKDVEVKNLSDCRVKVVIVSEECDSPNPHIPRWLDIMPHMMILEVGSVGKIRFTTAQKGIGSKQSSTRIFKKILIRAEPLLGGWQSIMRDYKLGVLLRAT